MSVIELDVEPRQLEDGTWRRVFWRKYQKSQNGSPLRQYRQHSVSRPRQQQPLRRLPVSWPRQEQPARQLQFSFAHPEQTVPSSDLVRVQ